MNAALTGRPESVVVIRELETGMSVFSLANACKAAALASSCAFALRPPQPSDDGPARQAQRHTGHHRTASAAQLHPQVRVERGRIGILIAYMD